MTYLVLDFETASEAELTEVGLYNYATHPSTRVLMLSYAFVESLSDKKPVVERWEPIQGPMPTELFRALRDPNIPIIAFNSAFERYIFKYVLKIDIPADRFQDPQASARYLSLPASLDPVGRVLGLPLELRKDKRGEDLIDLFSFPHTRKKKEGGGIYFNDWNSHPKEWAAFGEYCDQDVRAELEVARREYLLGAFPLPPRERAIWLFDQKVNDRGMPTDSLFVEYLLGIASASKEEKKKEQNVATGLENANSPAQLMPWVQKRGYPLNNLRKQNIELVLKDPEVKLTQECRDVLEARMVASSTSYKKLQAILQNINSDGNLRGQFIYMGSPRCGRWSGNAVQLHNMARPDGTFEDMDNVIKAREAVHQNAYEALTKMFWDEKKKRFYAPLIIAKNLIRTVFVAPPGKRFNVCDLNAIETRVAAWVAQCQSLLDVFKEGKDPYIAFAVKMYGIPYEKIYYDLKKNLDKVAKAAAKLMRQMAKPGVLGAVYRLGGGGWGFDKNGDRIKTGFWGYAEAMGVDMSQKQAVEVVKIFRNSYPEICGNGYNGEMKGIWVLLEEAVMDVLKGERTIRYIGPDNLIKIDKLTIEGRNPMLRIQLPSGRYLHYMDAAIETVKMPWQQKNEETGNLDDVYRPAFTYYGLNQDTKQWDMIVSHGGKIFENIVQAIARDVLAEAMLRAEKLGMEVVGHVHDELITLSDDDPFALGEMELQKLMSEPMSWAPSLPLGAEGWEDGFYHK